MIKFKHSYKGVSKPCGRLIACNAKDEIWLRGITRSMNLFSMGFLSSLDILFGKTIHHQPWRYTKVSASRITSICPPGQFYRTLSKSLYCLDNANHTQTSLQCHPCPVNTFNNKVDQPSCAECPYGTFALPGSIACALCSSDKAGRKNPNCLRYKADKDAARKRLLMGVLIPISIIAFAAVVTGIAWTCRKRIRKQSRLYDQDWMLSYQDLVAPHPTTVLATPPVRSCSAEDIFATTNNNTFYDKEKIGSRPATLQQRGSQRRSTISRMDTPIATTLPRHHHLAAANTNSVSDPDLIMQKEMLGLARYYDRKE